ncbi:MAG: EF-P lysine aminoacylase EpmA [Pseudomonadales bacterium]
MEEYAGWQPAADLDSLRARAALLGVVRQFFADRNVLEVETPLLAAHTVSDPHMNAVAVYVEDVGQGNKSSRSPHWLQTSPEYAMKRLLAAGSGDIYQISKSFRAGEQGSHHNLEFTLLEWYRLNFDQLTLIEETSNLLCSLFNVESSDVRSYAQLFETHYGCDPHSASANALHALAREHGIDCDENDASGMLDVLFSYHLQPQLQSLTFIYDYPESQSALARVEADAQGRQVARRFECFYKGVELGNGYHELLDAQELQRRHACDNQLRRDIGRPEVQLDPNLLGAMQHGLPNCAGIAIGLDRVLMLAEGKRSIADVMSFPTIEACSVQDSN